MTRARTGVSCTGFLAIVWALVICLGMAVMVDYETRPGQSTPAPHRWPQYSRIQRSLGQPQLVMFVHPRCACSRASIRELELLVARCRGRLVAHVLFLKPHGFDADWSTTDLWKSAAAITGVSVALDTNGREASCFGAATSGHTVLYDVDGQLLFSGGITASRGHSGDNFGRSTIVSLLNQPPAEVPNPMLPTESCVFGCPIFDAAEG